MYFNKDCALDFKSQYKRLILRYHPDKGGDAATFRAIQAEYKTILFLHSRDLVSDRISWADVMEEEDLDSQIKTLTDKILSCKH